MIITLTSDFGVRDHFVGTMKGVMLGIAPRASLVDISHDIQPFEILEGAFVLSQAWSYFPKGSIHVVVVDPGVGTERRPLLVEAGGHYFIAPDNGVLSMIYADSKHKVRAITNRKYMLPQVSRTFHGRDVFAPAAAHLARGAKPSTFGKLVTDAIHLATTVPTRQARRAWTGAVLHVDCFGNLVTNFHVSEFDDVRKGPFEFSVGLQRVARLALTFAECPAGELFAIVGSSGYVEIAVNQGSAAKQLGCGAGAPVDLVIF